MLPVAGSTDGEAHAARCCGTSERYTLAPRSQTTLALSTSTATSRSCVVAGSPGVVVCRYSRLPNTTGADRPPKGSDQATFSPAGDQRDGRFVSADVPSRFAPRHSGQSFAPSVAAAAVRSIPTVSRADMSFILAIGGSEDPPSIVPWRPGL